MISLFPPTKKAQISTEVLYSVGTMIIIFLLLTGITFNRKIEIKRTDDYLTKRTACLKVSNAISSVTASGNGAQIEVQVLHNVSIFSNSRIVVSETGATPRTIEAVCTFTGNVVPGNIGGIAHYNFTNDNGLVKICQLPNCCDLPLCIQPLT